MTMAKPFKMWATGFIMSHSITKSDHLHYFVRCVHLVLNKNKTMENCEHHWKSFSEVLHITQEVLTDLFRPYSTED